MTRGSDGTLVPDVKVGAGQMPWNAKPDSGRLTKDLPCAFNNEPGYVPRRARSV
jgi:hypothetical protein